MNPESAPDSIDDMLTRIARNALVAIIKKGEWLTISYQERVPVDMSLLRRCYAAVDMNRVRDLVTADLERRIADHILNALATEIGNDVKTILSNRELREDIRGVVRQKIRESIEATKEPT